MSEAPRGPTLDDRLRQRERPPGRAFMYHTWRDLLFLHWRVEPERIQRTLPPGLFVDTFDGAAWVGVVPFFMRNIRPRWLPSVPGLSNFMELNLRTYVHDAAGKPGVWFYALDCNQPLAVWGARTFFHLPYRHALMRAKRGVNDEINYHSMLYPGKNPPGHRVFTTDYRLGERKLEAPPGSLEFFLIERYVLFAAASNDRLFTGHVHHLPYSICEATIGGRQSSSFGHVFIDFDVGIYDRKPDHIAASPGVDVEVFNLRRA